MVECWPRSRRSFIDNICTDGGDVQQELHPARLLHQPAQVLVVLRRLAHGRHLAEVGADGLGGGNGDHLLGLEAEPLLQYEQTLSPRHRGPALVHIE